MEELELRGLAGQHNAEADALDIEAEADPRLKLVPHEAKMAPERGDDNLDWTRLHHEAKAAEAEVVIQSRTALSVCYNVHANLLMIIKVHAYTPAR